MTRALPGIVALVFVACAGTDAPAPLVEAHGVLAIAPATGTLNEASPRAIKLEFGAVPRGDVVSQEVKVINLGEAPLTVFGAESDSLSFERMEGFDVGVEIAPGEHALLALQFRPTQTREYTGTFMLTVDGAETGAEQAIIQLRGFGVDTVLASPEIDLGAVDLGESLRHPYTFTNYGQREVLLTEIKFQVGHVFSLDLSGDSLTVPPYGGTATIFIDVHRAIPGEFNDTLTWKSNLVRESNGSVPFKVIIEEQE